MTWLSVCHHPLPFEKELTSYLHDVLWQPSFVVGHVATASSSIKDQPTISTKQQSKCYSYKHIEKINSLKNIFKQNMTLNVHTPYIKWMINIFISNEW